MAGHRKNSSPSKRVVVSWGHGRGNAWVDLIDNGDGTYSYRSDNGGGYLGRMTRGQAIMEMEKRMGHLTPDAYKTKLRIKNPAGKPRRSTSLAGLDPAKKWHRKCPFCSAKTNIDRLGSSSRTWQQWQCPECGKWVDRPEADRRINPGLGMPGMPHTWVTANGTHVSAGDQVEFWSSEGGYGDRKKVRRKATVMRYLVFDDHVQVKMGTFGTTVDDGNFIRVTRRAR